jgi:hypothetical protein
MAEVNITSMVLSMAIMVFFIASGVFVINNTLKSHGINDSALIENVHYVEMQNELNILADNVEDEIEDTSFLDKTKNVITSTLDTVTLGATKALRRLGTVRNIFISAEKWVKAMFQPYLPDFVVNNLFTILFLMFSLGIISAWLRYKP